MWWCLCALVVGSRYLLNPKHACYKKVMSLKMMNRMVRNGPVINIYVYSWLGNAGGSSFRPFPSAT
jgi:hypothetical protein